MSKLSIPTLATLADAAIAADDAWNDAYASGNNDALVVADSELITTRAEFYGALFATTGISREMFGRLGVVL